MPTVPLCPGCKRPMVRDETELSPTERRPVALWVCGCGVTVKEGRVRTVRYPPDYNRAGRG